MSGCKHPFWAIREGGPIVNPTTQTCIVCDDYVSWGPSNDTPEVLVEIRAAEIAANYVDLPWVEWNHGEAAGFDNRETPMPHSAESWHAGYLARVIVSHDKDAP